MNTLHSDQFWQHLEQWLIQTVSKALANHTPPATVPAKEDAILTIKEVAIQLKRCPKFVRDEIKRGRLKADNPNRKTGARASWRVRESDITAYLKLLR